MKTGSFKNCDILTERLRPNEFFYSGPELFDFSEVCSFAVFSYFCPDVIQEKILFCQAAVSDRDCRVYIIVVIAKEDYVICILQAPSKVVDVRPWIIVSGCIKALFIQVFARKLR